MIQLISLPAGCITCNAEVQNALYNTEFLPNLLKMISGFGLNNYCCCFKLFFAEEI